MREFRSAVRKSTVFHKSIYLTSVQPVWYNAAMGQNKAITMPAGQTLRFGNAVQIVCGTYCIRVQRVYHMHTGCAVQPLTQGT
jgi:hypothetical protein